MVNIPHLCVLNCQRVHLSYCSAMNAEELDVDTILRERKIGLFIPSEIGRAGL